MMKPFSRYWRSMLGFLLVAVTLSSCISTFHHTGATANAVGLWKEHSSVRYAITLRRADGTYRRKEIQDCDYAKPPIKYESAGRWSISGRKYTDRLEQVSTPVWKKDVGKQWTLEVVSMTHDLFRHLSSDGAIVEERRIGEASEVQFEKTPLKKLQ